MQKSELLSDEAATLSFGGRLALATRADPSGDVGRPASGSGPSTLGAMIYLCGDLGAGKTTLARGLLRGYGYQGPVKSPTYTLVEPYELERCQIYHFDLYRLADPAEVEFLGADAYFAPTTLCLVEWPERGRGEIPHPDLTITLTTQGKGRLLQCDSGSDRGEQILQRLWPAGRN